MVKTVKAWFKRISDKAMKPRNMLWTLPKGPAQLKAERPELYATVYTSEPPGRCKFDMMLFEELTS